MISAHECRRHDTAFEWFYTVTYERAEVLMVEVVVSPMLARHSHAASLGVNPRDRERRARDWASYQARQLGGRLIAEHLHATRCNTVKRHETR